MTNIRISSLDISYFKGIRKLHLEFPELITSLYGENGSGKTTIADAILWVLFGRNSEGSAQFSIMTLDADGKPVANVENSVTLSLYINDVKRDLKKQYIETKVKRRGRETDEVKHDTNYYVDGEAMAKKDYETFIHSIVDESTFKAVTDPRYFLSLHWKEQRAFLERIAGDIDYSSIDGDARFDAITKESQFKSLEEYLQHLNYNIRIVKEKIDQIPARLEEQKATCPEEQDWSALETSSASLTHECNELLSRLHQLQNGSESAEKAMLRNKLEFANKRIEEMRRSAYNMSTEQMRKRSDDERVINAQITDVRNTSKGLSAKLNVNQTMLERAEQSLRQLEEDKVQLRKEWQEKVNRPFVRPTEAVCPLCHRPYTGADYEEEMRKLESDYNVNRATNKEMLTQRADKIKQDIASAEATIKSCTEFIAECKTQLDECRAKEQNLQDNLKELTGTPLKSAEELLAINPAYQQATDERKLLMEQIDGAVAVDNSVQIEEVKGLLETKNGELREVNTLLATKATYTAHITRIDELQTEAETLNFQLDSLLQRKDNAEEYQALRDQLLEDTVNAKFTLVHFHLFDTLNDGTRKPNCIPWVSTENGFVPIADANSATRMNAGLDIINAIADYYEVYAPVVIDSSESNLHIVPTKGQQLRLYVSTDKEITIR